MENQRSGMRRLQGFTLLELMIVVAVLAIVVAIALPGFLQSRIAANEGSAISSTKHVVSANEQYRLRFGSFADSISDLGAAGYIDDSMSDSLKSGYTFSYVGYSDDYDLNGDPVSPGLSGNRYFFVDSSGVIRFSTTGPATNTDTALGN